MAISFTKGPKNDAKHTLDCEWLKEKEKESFGATQPKCRFKSITLNRRFMLETPPV